MMNPRRRKVLQSIEEGFKSFNAKDRRGRKGCGEES